VILIKIKRGWELPESAATPEGAWLNRRALLKAAVAGPILAGLPGLLAGCDEPTAQAASDGPGIPEGALNLDDPSAGLYPVQRNMRYSLDRDLSEERLAITYNNFYEFGSSKNIWEKAQDLPLRPWTVKIAGLVEEPMEIAIDDLLKRMPLEERIYRHRCVEAWSMAVPWSGFPLKALVEMALPLGSAKYLKMVTFENPEIASGQRANWYPWPYEEGLTLAEATNELAFIATGIYGKPMPKQNGAPLRLAVPWKYGFKSIKSIVRFTFTEKRPVGYWEKTQGKEYGFWANVNPKVDHPRWSQASERVLGSNERVPTLLYNGYGAFVADIYKGMTGERLFM
jgi:sulfoxide reductase catalytic subunit YedY